MNENKKDFVHLMLLSSNYNKGKRICLHFVVTDNFTNDISKIISSFNGNENVALYQIVTDDNSWKSVVDKEPFFNEVKFYDGHNPYDVQTFYNLVAKSDVAAFDIALYLLTKDKLDYASLMIYLYYTYCMFLIKFDKELFKDSIKCESFSFSMYSLKEHFQKYSNAKFLEENFFNQIINGDDKFFAKKREIVLSKMISLFKNREEIIFIDQCYNLLKKIDIHVLRDNILDKNSPFVKTLLNNHKNEPCILKNNKIKNSSNSFDFVFKLFVDIY